MCDLILFVPVTIQLTGMLRFYTINMIQRWSDRIAVNVKVLRDLFPEFSLF